MYLALYQKNCKQHGISPLNHDQRRMSHMALLEKCQSAFDSTLSSKRKVPQSNKEANNFYHKVLKRMTRVKSTVVAEVERIEE